MTKFGEKVFYDSGILFFHFTEQNENSDPYPIYLAQWQIFLICVYKFTLYFMPGNGHGIIRKVKPDIYWSCKSQICFFTEADVIESSIELLDNHMKRLGISLTK